jgi:hypothetical protein
MTDQHPITPPPELVQQWDSEAVAAEMPGQFYLATQAARWGADQELEACCEWLVNEGWFRYEHEAVQDLRAARRPKPPSLKAQALALIDKIQGSKEMWQIDDLDVVRRALEGHGQA